MSKATFLNDGEHYDALHDRITGDLPFWVDRASDAGGPVLELACGTGRITTQVAEVADSVVGIDRCVPYLARAVRKCAAQASVRFLASDVRAFCLRQRFALAIFTFGSAAVLGLGDLVPCFTCVRQHLDRDGGLILDVYSDRTELPPTRETTLTYELDGVSVSVNLVREYAAATRVETVLVSMADQEGTYDQVGTLALRHHTVPELTSALRTSGFVLTEELLSYDGTEGHDSHFRIMVARAT